MATLEAAEHATPPLRRLMQLIAPERHDVGVVITFSVLVGLLTLAVPIAVQALVNFVAFGGLVQPLLILSAVLFAFLALAGFVRTIKTYAVEMIQRRLFVRTAHELAHRLPRVRMSEYDRHHGPELVNRFFEVLTLQKAGSILLLDGIGVALQSCIALVILAFYHPFLLAFDIVLVGVVALILFVVGRGGVATAIAESRAKYAVAAALEEIARNPLTFKSLGGMQYAAGRTDRLAVDYVQARQAHFRIVLRQIVGAVLLQAVAGTALLLVGGWLVIQGQLTLGQLVAAELIVASMLAAFAKFGKQLESFYDLLAGVDKLGQLLDLQLDLARAGTADGGSGPAGLLVHDVSYAFPGRPPIIQGLSLQVEPGERVCVFGTQGSGKSTLAELLYGVRTPAHGYLALDGDDYRDLGSESLRSAVALVKGFEVIEASIFENVRLGRSEIDRAMVREALDRVGLLDEVRLLPDGIETPLNAQGRPLSGGQLRRILIARAIVARPRLIVVDGLLDDLDADATRQVLQALFHPDRSWTVVVLSHAPHMPPGFDRQLQLSALYQAGDTDASVTAESAR